MHLLISHANILLMFPSITLHAVDPFASQARQSNAVWAKAISLYTAIDCRASSVLDYIPFDI